MALQLIVAEAQVPIRAHRRFRDRINPLDNLNDREMYKQYRFTRAGCMKIIDLLHNDLVPATQRNHAIPPSLQVFTALKFYATGSLLTCAGNDTGISIASASRIIRRVSLSLERRKNQRIIFPTTPAAVEKTKANFFALQGFPNTVGAVDCTHVQLRGCNLGPNEHVFVNRKHYHSINVQLMCDADYRITNVVARWPGSKHDQSIFQNSRVGQMMEDGQINGLLIADGGYYLRPWMMTPFASPSTAGEIAYNK